MVTQERSPGATGVYFLFLPLVLREQQHDRKAAAVSFRSVKAGQSGVRACLSSCALCCMTRIVVDKDSPLGLAKSVVMALQLARVKVTPRTVTLHLLLLENARMHMGRKPHTLDVIQPAFWSLCPPSHR